MRLAAVRRAPRRCVAGEGTGAVVLESLGRALAHGAGIIAEVTGHGAAGDATTT